MPQFFVYFEIFGKRMKTNVTAENELMARVAIKDKIRFHRVERIPETDSGILDLFNDIFNRK